MVTRGWKLGNRLLLFKGYKPPTVSEGGSNYSVVMAAKNTVSQTWKSLVWMDRESAIQSQVSQQEKNKYFILMHLEKWSWWTWLQGGNRDAGVKKGLVGTEG